MSDAKVRIDVEAEASSADAAATSIGHIVAAAKALESTAGGASKLAAELVKAGSAAGETAAQMAKLNANTGSDQALGRLRAVTSELQKQRDAEAKIAGFDAARARQIAVLEDRYKKMRAEATKGIGETPKAGPAAEITPGMGALGLGGAAKWLTVAGAIAGSMELAKDAAGLLIDAGERLTAAGFSLGEAGYKLAVDKTAEREAQNKSLDALTHGHGEAAVKLGIKIAADYNLPPEEGVAKVKELLASKFSAAEIPAIVRVQMGLNKGFKEGAGDDVIAKIEAAKQAGTADAKFFKGLKKDGIDVQKVYAQLAKDMGMSVEKVKERIKKQGIGAAEATKVVLDVAGKKYGAIADELGNGIPGLLNRLRIAVGELFVLDPKQLEPLKNMLKGAEAFLKGPAGQMFKKFVSTTFDEISGALTGAFQTVKMALADPETVLALKETASDIKGIFRAMVETVGGDMRGAKGAGAIKDFAKSVGGAAKDIQEIIRDFKPLIDLIKELGSVGGKGHALKELWEMTGLKAALDQLRQLLALKVAIAKAMAKGSGSDASAALPKGKAGADPLAGVKQNESILDKNGKGPGVPGYQGPAVAKAAAKAAPAAKAAANDNAVVGADAADAKAAANDNASGADDAKGQANDTAGAVAKPDVDTMGSGTELGGDLAAGMAQGIAAGESAAINAAVSMVDKAVQAARAKAGAHSPATATIGLGGDMGDGLSVGLQQKHGQVAKSGGDLSSMAIGGASKGAGGAAGAAGAGAKSGGGPIQIIINAGGGGGKGGSPQEIASAVKQALRDLGLEAA